MNPAAILGVAIAAVVIAVLVGFYVWVYRRNAARGDPGFIVRCHLTCPKCRGSFDYDLVPGASLTSVRLGTSRYLACPVCHRWSMFDVSSTQVPRPGAGPRTG